MGCCFHPWSGIGVSWLFTLLMILSQSSFGGHQALSLATGPVDLSVTNSTNWYILYLRKQTNNNTKTKINKKGVYQQPPPHPERKRKGLKRGLFRSVQKRYANKFVLKWHQKNILIYILDFAQLNNRNIRNIFYHRNAKCL